MLTVVALYMYVQVALKVDMPSPGFVFEPYRVPEPISFWKRLNSSADVDSL